MKSLGTLVLGFGLLLIGWSLPAPANAAPLFLNLNESPDIFSSFIDVSYDATTDTFTASGFALEFDDDGIGPASSIVAGTFQLNATIDELGTLAPGGTLTITGTVPGLSFNSGTILTGNVSEIGFRNAGGDPLEFLIAVTGGDAAGFFPNGQAGVILGDTNFAGTFASDFGNLESAASGTGTGSADVAPIRETPPDGERGHPGCNRVDCQLTLTSSQPTYWSALTGQPGGCQPFTVLDPGFPNGRPDPDGPPGSRMLRGYVLAWAVNGAGQEISWNHLQGSATVVEYDTQSAWEVNAYSFQAVSASLGEPTDNIPGQLKLDGIEYSVVFGRLVLDFYASDSSAFSNRALGDIALLDTDLTLLPMGVDLRQDAMDSMSTKAKFDLWNQNEIRFSGTQRCLGCWDQVWLSQFDAPNHFLRENLQTDRGRARIDGIASNACPFSVDTPLLGTAVKRVVFMVGDAVVGSGRSASPLRGQGREEAIIHYDIIDPPGEAGSGPLVMTDFSTGRFLSASGDATTDPTAFVAPSDRVSISAKGSLLVFPKVEIRWDEAGNVTQDTFLSLTNDFPLDVAVQLYFVNGDPALNPEPAP